MKPIELIQFVEANAKEILGKEVDEQDEMMENMDTCVLRPFKIPEYIIDQLTKDEFNEYSEMAKEFCDSREIFKAVECVRGWVNS